MFDISISRVHAEIRKVDNDFYLADQKSKFGTLVLAKRALPVRESKPLLIQAGRTLLSIAIKKPFCTCCLQYQALPARRTVPDSPIGVPPNEEELLSGKKGLLLERSADISAEAINAQTKNPIHE